MVCSFLNGCNSTYYRPDPRLKTDSKDFKTHYNTDKYNRCHSAITTRLIHCNTLPLYEAQACSYQALNSCNGIEYMSNDLLDGIRYSFPTKEQQLFALIAVSDDLINKVTRIVNTAIQVHNEDAVLLEHLNTTIENNQANLEEVKFAKERFDGNGIALDTIRDQIGDKTSEFIDIKNKLVGSDYLLNYDLKELVDEIDRRISFFKQAIYTLESMRSEYWKARDFLRPTLSRLEQAQKDAADAQEALQE